MILFWGVDQIPVRVWRATQRGSAGGKVILSLGWIGFQFGFGVGPALPRKALQEVK